MNEQKKLLIVIFLFLLAMFPFAITLTAYADEQHEANYTDGSLKYYLSAPDTIEIELELYGDHSITLHNGETVVIQWNSEVPQETIEEFCETITVLKQVQVSTPVPSITPLPGFTWPPGIPNTINTEISYRRQMIVHIVNTLSIIYSKDDFITGKQFLSGSFTREIEYIEQITSDEIVPVVYEYGINELIIQELAVGNFQSISEEHTIPISFPQFSREIVRRIEPKSLPPIPTRLDELYSQVELIKEYAQDLGLPLEFIIELIEDVIPVEIQEINEETAIEEVEELIEEAKELVLNEQVTGVPTPQPNEIAATAAVSAVLAGIIGSAAAVSAGSTSGIVSAAVTTLQQTAQTVIPGAVAGNSVISFLRDVITGLRDMFVDEGRAHASGKVSENLGNLGEK